MGDLYTDDITSDTTYPEAELLRDIRALIATGQRESTVLDYKSDISPKDNWPETVAAFANTLGGLIIFGITGTGDQPRALTGYDPKGIEMKTRLSSTILSRIQPRPTIDIRTITLDTDNTREVTLLRVNEGNHPPYLHNKEHEHRVYIRTGAQKAEADYLQLNSLYEKRTLARPPQAIPTNDLHQRLSVRNPADKNKPSDRWYRLIATPTSTGAAQRLTAATEEAFEENLARTFTDTWNPSSITREQHLTTYRHWKDTGHEQVFAITTDGTLAYATHAGTMTNDGLFFNPWECCNDIITFLALITRQSEQSRYYGEHHLAMSIIITDARILKPGSYRQRLVPGPLYNPNPDKFTVNMTAETRLQAHPTRPAAFHNALRAIANDTARAAGTLLSPTFDQFANAFIDETLNTLGRQ